MAKDDSAKKKRVRDDDDEDDRPRRRRRDEDDEDNEEEEDRPRRRRPRAEEEDEEEDRPRRKRRASRDEDEEESPRRKRRPKDDDDDEEEDSEEDESEEEDEDKPRKGSKKKKLQKVKNGLVFNIYAAAFFLTAMGSLVLSVVLFIVAILLAWVEILYVVGYLMLLFLFFYFTMQVPAVIGYCMCLAAPNKRGTLVLAILSLIAGATNLTFRVVFIILVVSAFGTSVSLGPAFFATAGTVGNIFIMVSDIENILFCFYLRALSLNMRDQYLAQSCNIPVALACGVIAFKLICGFVVSVKNVRGEGGADMLFSIFLLVVMLIYFFFALSYLRLMLAVRNRVAAALPPSPDELP